MKVLQHLFLRVIDNVGIRHQARLCGTLGRGGSVLRPVFQLSLRGRSNPSVKGGGGDPSPNGLFVADSPPVGAAHLMSYRRASFSGLLYVPDSCTLMFIISGSQR